MSDIAELRYRNQLLAQTTLETPAQVVARFGAIQAQDYLAALWAVGLRTRGATEAEVERAVAEGEIVRSWPVRGTLHFMEAGDVRWLLELLAPRVVARGARRLNDLGLDRGVVARAADVFSRSLEGGRRLTREELRAALRGAGIDTGGQRTYHLLWRCALDGLICLGPRRGKQHTFVLLDEWVPAAAPLAREEALARLARLYFTAHGPATARDFAWWSGLAPADARQGLELVRGELRRHERPDGEYWSAVEAEPSSNRPHPARLLPAFDEYLVGYARRDAVLDPEHASSVNAGGGLLGPTIALHAHIAGVWKRTLQRGAVVVQARLFAGASAQVGRSLESAAAEYGRFLGLAPRLEVARSRERSHDGA